MRSRFAIAVMLGALSFVGCDQQAPDGPPQVRYGQDECIHCGMILSEERHTAAIVHVRDGRRESLLFDDMGDLMDYERENPGLAVHRRYVHDLDTKRWLTAEAAAIVHSPSLHTPMGSGLAAFDTRESADAAAKRLGDGRVLDWPAAVAERARAVAARSASAATPAASSASPASPASPAGGGDPPKACCPGGHHDPQSAPGTTDR